MSFLTVALGIAVLTGLYGLFRGTNPFAKSVPLKKINKDIIGLIITVASAWVCYKFLWVWLGVVFIWVGVVLLLISAGILFGIIEGYLMHFDIRSREKPYFALFSIIAIACVYFSFQTDMKAIEDERNRMEAERTAVATISKNKTYWKLARGAAESKAGQMIGWLAVDDYIPIDWQYEQELEQKGQASRSIPIKVVLLNNSFEDVEMKAMSAWHISVKDEYWLWRVWITHKHSNSVVWEWSEPVVGNRILFMPIEKADFNIEWNGRDSSGKLLPEGNYELHLETAAVMPEEKPIRMYVNLSFSDDGPKKIYKPDPHLERIRQNQRWDRIWKGMRQTIQLNRRMMFQFNRPR